MKPWEEVSDDPLSFPVRGKTYVLPELDYKAWLTIQQIQSGEVTDVADGDDTWRLVMGSMWDEMVADNVPAEALARAGLASLAFIQLGRDMAESVWEAGLDPKAIAAAIAERPSQLSKISTSTESEDGTPSPGSSTPTTSRKGSSRKKRANASLSATSRHVTGR